MVLDEFEDIQAHAARFQKDPRTLRRWMAEPHGLPHTYAGRMPLFKVSWTCQWLECPSSDDLRQEPGFQERRLWLIWFRD
jgi:hypothetical protein